MIGLFMVLPVLAVYAQSLPGSTPLLVGLAVGIYGLTQATLQIPFGMASDRFGRKPVITLGLIIFALGSTVAALATSIHGVIIGRALQGAGAVAAAIMALAADLSSEEHRTKAMAGIGMSIGMSFIVAMVAGPMLNGWIGVSGIFWVIAVLAVAGIGILHLAVPHPTHTRFHRDTEAVPGQFRNVLRNTQLLRLDFGVMTLHLALTATFVVMPIALRDAASLPVDRHWEIYLPVMVLAMAAAVPFIIIGEKKKRLKEVFVGAVAVLGLAELGMMEFHGSLLAISVILWIFFSAFTLLEATLPSLLSKIAPVEAKGTAMGVYSTSQFIGAFIGGAAGGWFYGAYGFAAVFAFAALLIAVWLIAASGMQSPRYLTTRMINLGRVSAEDAARIETQMARIPGVAEVSVNTEDGIAYLKVEEQSLDSDALGALGAH